MKHELTMEALIASGDGVLAAVVQSLRAMTLPPESFVWSVMPETAEARIWMIVSTDETKLRELIADLSAIPGVRQVAVHAPGQSIIERLHPPEPGAGRPMSTATSLADAQAMLTQGPGNFP